MLFHPRETEENGGEEWGTADLLTYSGADLLALFVFVLAESLRSMNPYVFSRMF
jgi:hypothetical protein